MKNVYKLTVAGTDLYEAAGFWLDEPPTLDMPDNNHDDLQITIPYRSGTYSMASTLGVTAGGRTLSYKLRCVNTDSEAAVVSNEATLRQAAAQLAEVDVYDSYSGRTFEQCIITAYTASFSDSGYECTVDLDYYCPNSTDSGGVI